MFEKLNFKEETEMIFKDFKEKKMMKRVLAGLFAVMMVIAGCKSDDSDDFDPGASDSGDAGNKPVSSVKLNLNSLILGVNESAVLLVKVSPANASDKSVTWTSNNAGIATVDAKTGEVTGVETGIAVVTATTVSGGKTAACEVTVGNGILKVTGVSLDKNQLVLTEGGTATLVATETPNNVADKTVTWMSSNTEVATVDGDGTVTGVAKGSAIITATTVTSGKTAACAVTVVPPVSPVAYTVENEAEWNNVLATISSAGGGGYGNPAVFAIEIKGDFSAPGITPDNYSITGAYKEVRLTGDRTISLDSASTGSLIAAAENQKFVIDGPTLKGIETNTYPLVYVGGGSTVELASGAIKDNHNPSSISLNKDPRGADGSGGGVYVDGGTFTMTAGTISGNKTSYGGGVFIDSGIFTMEGGDITGNTANYLGGGVFIAPNGTFAPEGGTIADTVVNG
jgi:hypothetical protein